MPFFKQQTNISNNKKMRFIFLLIALLFHLGASAQNIGPCQGCQCFRNKTATWRLETDLAGKEYLTRGDSLKTHTFRTGFLMSNFNNQNIIKARIINIKNGIVYVKILNSAYLTQSIGDAGATSYITTLVYTLTEKYKYVYLLFEEGDHGGVPGLKSRKSMYTKAQICK